MTSEGQQAGRQPAEATSGNGTPGAEGFPLDAEGEREPSSYAPPPQATPNGGSPFVVPAVPPPTARPFPEPPANRYGVPTAGPESVWAPPPSSVPERPERPERPEDERPPGLSAFGDQRVRVPGATLSDLPGDQPPSVPSAGAPPTTAPMPVQGTDPLPRRTPTSGNPFAQQPVGNMFTPASDQTATPPSPPPPPAGGGRGVTPLPTRRPFGEAASDPAAAARPSRPAFSTDDSRLRPFGEAGSGAPPTRPPFGEPSSFGTPGSASPFGQRPGSEQSAPRPGSEQSAPRPGGEQSGPFGPRPSGSDAQHLPGGPFSAIGDPDVPAAAPPPAEEQPSAFGSPYSSGTYGSLRGDDDFGSPAAANPFGERPAAGAPATYGIPRAAEPEIEADRPAGYGPGPVDQPSGGFRAADQPAASFGATDQPSGSFGATDQPSGSFGTAARGPAAEPSGAYGMAAGSPAVFGTPRTGDHDSDSDAAGTFGRPASPYGGPASSPFGESTPGSNPFGESDARPSSPFGESDARPSSPFGESDARPSNPFGENDGRLDDERPAAFGGGRFGDPSGPGGPGGPTGSPAIPNPSGNAFAPSPPSPESRNGSVPQPRNPGDQAPTGPSSGGPGGAAPSSPATSPATGTARPVSASASVPMASRTAPVDPAEVPPPVAAPQSRVYGRPAATPPDDEPAGGDEASASDGAWPWDRNKEKQPPAPDNSMYQRQPAPPFGAPSTGSPSFGSPAFGSPAAVPPPPPFAPQMPPSGPQSPGRVAPDSAPPGGSPFSEFTTDVAGRGRPQNAPPPPDQFGPPPDQFGSPPLPDPYGEHTTDISGRGRPNPEQPYVPQSALPQMHAAPPRENGFPPPNQPPAPHGVEGERNRMGGMFPGPASRATVTPPPPPDATAAWPGGLGDGSDGDQNRFDNFKAETDAAPAAKPETHVRMLPILIGVIIVAGLVVGLALGLVYLISGNSDNNTGFAVKVGECVKRDGENAVKSACSDAGAFEVTAVADSKDKCGDPGQPYVLNPVDGGRTQVLCLQPRT